MLQILLPLSNEFQVAFVEDDLLDVLWWNLPHKHTLRISIFKPLNKFIFEIEVLENLVEHVWRHLVSDSNLSWEICCRLLRINLKWFLTLAELIKLAKYLCCFIFEFGLEGFQRLLNCHFLLCHDTWLDAMQIINLYKQIFGRSLAVFEVLQDTLFWKMTDGQDVFLLELLSNNPRHNRFVKWNEFIFDNWPLLRSRSWRFHRLLELF